MSFNKLNSNAKALLYQILEEENPTEFLNNKFRGLSSKEDGRLRSILHELIEKGYIKITWADNVPYHVTIRNEAFSYKENLLEYKKKDALGYSINIGNNNTISNSNIVGKVITELKSEKKGFNEKHPIICSILVSFVIGFILLFPFWKKVIDLVEGWF